MMRVTTAAMETPIQRSLSVFDAKVRIQKLERKKSLVRTEYLDRRVEGEPEYADSGEIHPDTRDGLVTVDHKGKFF